jgi:release factor glutamine methyltransferase
LTPTSTIQSLRENIKKELAGIYPDREINAITEVLCLHRLDLKRHEMGLRKHEILMPQDLAWFDGAIRKLREKTPVQHITGEVEFLGMKLGVGPQALVPRPETEELVQWILDDHEGERCSILDIGTGTGCIALALARDLPRARVYATDNSREALRLAADNARRLGISVEFILHDICGDELPEVPRHADLIVCNPPYIPEGQKESLDINVRDFDPPSALFVPDEDPLLFYRHISRLGLGLMQPGGMLYCEIHEEFGAQVISLLGESGYGETELRKDINGKDRMVRARKQ